MEHKDRRTQRTKRSLRTALLGLMRERGYDAISIQEIVDRADVGRSTFYCHYADKEDLLQENLAALADHIEEKAGRQRAAGGHPVLAFSRPMLEHVADAKPMFVGLLGPHASKVVQSLFRDTLAQLVQRGAAAAEAAVWPGEVPEEIVVELLVAGFQAVARWWVLEAPNLSLEEVHGVYLRAVSPLLGRGQAALV